MFTEQTSYRAACLRRKPATVKRGWASRVHPGCTPGPRLSHARASVVARTGAGVVSSCSRAAGGGITRSSVGLRRGHRPTGLRRRRAGRRAERRAGASRKPERLTCSTRGTSPVAIVPGGRPRRYRAGAGASVRRIDAMIALPGPPPGWAVPQLSRLIPLLCPLGAGEGWGCPTTRPSSSGPRCSGPFRGVFGSVAAEDRAP